MGFPLSEYIIHGCFSPRFFVASKLFNNTKPSLSLGYLSPAFIAAIFFATHPVHTEAAAWIAGIPDLSFAFFFLLLFYLYMRATEDECRLSFYLPSLASFTVAAFCKEPARTLLRLIEHPAEIFTNDPKGD
jgi:hypothetical protein